MPAPVRVTNIEEESFACQREDLTLSRRRLLFQHLGVSSTTLTVTGLLPHWPPAHQTSCLSQCPDLATALPASSPRHPASPSPSLVQASFLQARLLLTTQFAMCLGHLSSCFVCRVKSWVRGDLGTGDSETGEAERVVGGELRLAAGLCPGRDSAISWRWQAQRMSLVVVEEALFQKPKCVPPRSCPDRNQLCCSTLGRSQTSVCFCARNFVPIC